MSEELKKLLTCQVCNELCKRGVSLQCCNARACRACATKEVTSKRICWNPNCKSPVTKTEDLVNDETLRSAVASFKDKGTVPADLLTKLKAADAVQKKLEQGQSASANDNNGGKTAASPAKTTSSPAKTSTAPAKTTTTPAKTTSTATAAADKNSANVYSLNKNKRKSEAGDGATGAKKKNSELTYKYVFMDMQIVQSGARPPFLHQLACLYKPSNGPAQSIFMPVGNKIQLQSMPEAHKQAINCSEENGEYSHIRKNYKTIYIETVALAHACIDKFVKDLKKYDSNTRVVLVVYNDTICNLMYKFLFQPNNPKYFAKFGYSFDDVFVMTSIMDKFKMDFNSVAVNEVLGIQHQKGPDKCFKDCIESVQFINQIFQRLCKDDIISNLKKPDDKKFRMYPFIQKAPTSAHINVIFSSQVLLNGWTLPKLPQVVKPATKETKVCEGGDSAKPKSAATTKGQSDKDDEIVIVDEPILADTPFPTGVYPLFTQPILVKFNNLPPKSKAVDFLSSSAMGCKTSYYSKVYYQAGQGSAYGFFYYSPRLTLNERFRTYNTDMTKFVKATTNFGTVRVNNNYSTEESRKLKKITKVDLVFSQDPNQSHKSLEEFVITTKPCVVLVKLKPQTVGDEISFTTKDVFLYIKSKLPNLDIVTYLFCPERKGNLAKVVFVANDAAKEVKIRTGDMLGTALLFQGDNMSLLLARADLQGEAATKLHNSQDIIPILDKPVGRVLTSNLKRPCKTLKEQSIYSHVNNQILVKLCDYTLVDEKKAFGEAKLQLDQEFIKMISPKNSTIPAKLRDPSFYPVIWFEKTPYAVIEVTLNSSQKAPIESQAIKYNTTIATYIPVESPAGPNPPNLEMSVCVDFDEKHCYVGQEPLLVNAYLKFNAVGVPKKDVIKNVFAVTEVLNSKVSVLTVVFKPFGDKLAPEKTQTNDLKCKLLVYCAEGSAWLKPREVLATAVTMGRPKFPLVPFKKCGVAVEYPDPTQEEDMMEYEQFEDSQEKEKQDRIDMRMRMEKMRERARAFQSSNNAAQSSSSYSAWEEDDLRIRNDDRHSMGGMSGQRGGYGGGSSRFSHQGQDNSMAVSSFGGQGSGARYGQAGITGGQNFGVGHMDQYAVNQRYTQPPPQFGVPDPQRKAWDDEVERFINRSQQSAANKTWNTSRTEQPGTSNQLSHFDRPGADKLLSLRERLDAEKEAIRRAEEEVEALRRTKADLSRRSNPREEMERGPMMGRMQRDSPHENIQRGFFPKEDMQRGHGRYDHDQDMETTSIRDKVEKLLGMTSDIEFGLGINKDRSMAHGSRDEKLMQLRDEQTIGLGMRDERPPLSGQGMRPRFRDDMQDERSFGQGMRDNLPAQFGRDINQGMRDEMPVQFGRSLRDDGRRDEMPVQFSRTMGEDRAFGHGASMREENTAQFGRSYRDERQSAFGRENTKRSHADSDDELEIVGEVTKPHAETPKANPMMGSLRGALQNAAQNISYQGRPGENQSRPQPDRLGENQRTQLGRQAFQGGQSNFDSWNQRDFGGQREFGGQRDFGGQQNRSFNNCKSPWQN